MNYGNYGFYHGFFSETSTIDDTIRMIDDDRMFFPYQTRHTHLERVEIEIEGPFKLIHAQFLGEYPQFVGHKSPQSPAGFFRALGSRANLLRELRWWSWRNSNGPIQFVYLGLSENSVPLNPMVLLIIIPFLNGYFIGGIPHFQTYPFGVSLDILDPVLVGSQSPRAKALWQFKTDQRLKRLLLSYTFLGPKKINENFRILKWSYCTTKRPQLVVDIPWNLGPKEKPYGTSRYPLVN